MINNFKYGKGFQFLDISEMIIYLIDNCPPLKEIDENGNDEDLCHLKDYFVKLWERHSMGNVTTSHIFSIPNRVNK
jgi:hypothetical protein